MTEPDAQATITRREAVRRVTALLGGIALVGGEGLLTGCRADTDAGSAERDSTAAEKFSAADIAYLDEIAETILPATKTPGAKAAATGAFMALMVTDGYSPSDQRVFRQGMQTIDAATQKAHGTTFMKATPQQRLAVLQVFDQEQKTASDARAERGRAAAARRLATPTPPRAGDAKAAPAAAAADTARTTGAKAPEDKAADAFLPDQRQENAGGAGDANPAPGVTAEEPTHFFRMMKELALLGYFTSEIGYTQAQRYVESPGKFEPCVPYVAGEPAWAPHA